MQARAANKNGRCTGAARLLHIMHLVLLGRFTFMISSSGTILLNTINIIGDTICSDDDPNYPEKEVQALLQRHGLFASKEYFKRLFDQPCIFHKKPKNEPLIFRSGLNFDESKICTSLQTFTYPKKGKTIKGEWKYIVNTEEYQQGITVHKCRGSEGQSCKYNGAPGNFDWATQCKQNYKKHSFLSINLDGSIDFEDFEVPASCACHILDKSPFVDFK